MSNQNKKHPSSATKHQRDDLRTGARHSSIINVFNSEKGFNPFISSGPSEHCLNTTLKALATQPGLEVTPDTVIKPNQYGSSTIVIRFWFDKPGLETIAVATEASLKEGQHGHH